jgi:hypothetical protein
LLVARENEQLDPTIAKPIIQEFASTKPDAWKLLLIDLEPDQCPQLCDTAGKLFRYENHSIFFRKLATKSPK